MAAVFASIIFITMFVLIILDKWPREYSALGAAFLTIIVVFGLCMHSGEAILETFNFRTFAHAGFWYQSAPGGESSVGINWSTIVFIAGMMIMVEGIAESGFFQWLCLRLARAVRYRAMPLFLLFMALSFFLAMFIDSITVVLFLSTITLELARLLHFDAGPMILAEIFCANLGGSATMCGDPPNIIIGTSLGYTFMEFLTNTGPIALAGLAAVILYFWLINHSRYRSREASPEERKHLPQFRDVINSRPRFICSIVTFLIVIALLVTHAQTGLTVATIGCIAAALTLAWSGRHSREVLSKIDYRTLLFFVGLFIVINGLELTGVLRFIADGILHASGGRSVRMMLLILWASGFASAFIDNIPFAATMVPVLKLLSAASGVPLTALAWCLAIGADVGGSATPIGASANVVGVTQAAHHGVILNWKNYCKEAVPAAVLVLAVSTVLLLTKCG